jgi:hypothetical protein
MTVRKISVRVVLEKVPDRTGIGRSSGGPGERKKPLLERTSTLYATAKIVRPAAPPLRPRGEKPALFLGGLRGKIGRNGIVTTVTTNNRFVLHPSNPLKSGARSNNHALA